MDNALVGPRTIVPWYCFSFASQPFLKLCAQLPYLWTPSELFINSQCSGIFSSFFTPTYRIAASHVSREQLH